MKRIGHIYEKIYTMENLKQAHKKAREDKTYYHDVQMVDSAPEHYLGQIQAMLRDKTYTVGKYTYKKIIDKGKERELMKLPYFPDRIIQWAIMLQLEPVLMKTLCTHTCASIPGRGGDRVAKLMHRYLKDEKGTAYCLKIDVHHFYQSLDHSILKSLLRRRIKDGDLLWLLDLIIDSYPDKVGVPIGSYLSQYLGNFYLAYFDHWLKEKQRVRYVMRYMDDIVIMHATPYCLHLLLDEIQKYLDGIKLSLNNRWSIFPVRKRGVDYVGYRYFGAFTLMRKKTARRLKRCMRRIQKAVAQGVKISVRAFGAFNSYLGRMAYCNSFRLFEKYVNLDCARPYIRHWQRYRRKVLKMKWRVRYA